MIKEPPNYRTIALWLFICAGLVCLLVVVGGLTRLSESGLSMVEWQPIAGILPPLSAEAWREEFLLYQQSPEYRVVNHGMVLADFKRIFWMEYAHRVLGRLVGIVYLLPLLVFVARWQLGARLKLGLFGLFVLGGLQGLLGWYMVKSGLVNEPHVSQYRLTAHLSLAVLLYSSLFLTALSLWRRATAADSKGQDIPAGSKLWSVRALSIIVVGLVALMIFSGGFMAGTRAGTVFNTFPLIEGRLWPVNVWALEPGWRNLFENVVTIQIVHRGIAMLTLFGTICLWWQCRRTTGELSRVANLVIVAVGCQVALGVATLLNGQGAVPLKLAAMHQTGAVVVLTLVLYLVHCVHADSRQRYRTGFRTAALNPNHRFDR